MAMVTNLSGSARLKIMIKEKKSGIFLHILCWYGVFELRFEIRSPKLSLTPNLSLIHRKTKKQQRFSTFLGVATHQNDDYDIIHVLLN